MAEEIERLVLSPFKEIVEKANTAIQNAKDAEDDGAAAPMLKAAQSLAKEGERALKRIEPLCKKNYEEYGANFVNALKEHDEIAQFRSELDDLLWDFDDFIEVDDFDADKFEELQKSSRKAAPRTMDILKRMKLEKPVMAPASAPTPEPSEPSRRASTVIDPPSSSSKTMAEVEQQLSEMLVMGAQAGPDLGVNGLPVTSPVSRPVSDLERSSSHYSVVSEEPSEPPPRPPSTDPWKVDRPPPLSPSARSDDVNPIERRSPVGGGDSPTLPAALPVRSPRRPSNDSRNNSQGSLQDFERLRRQGVNASTDSESSNWRDRNPHAPSGRPRADSLQKAMAAADKARAAHGNPVGGNNPPRYSGQSLTSVSDMSRSPSNASPHLGHPSLAIPEDSAVDNYTYRPGRAAIITHPPRQASLNAQPSYVTHQPSMDSLNSSVFDLVTDTGTISPVGSPERASSGISITSGSPYSPVSQLPQYSIGAQPPNYTNGSRSSLHSPVEFIDNNSSTTLTIQARGRTGSEVSVPRPFFHGYEDPGLIPVDSETPEDPSMPSRQPDCSIGPHSSFYQMKGFCKGAQEVRNEESAFKKIKRPVGNFSHKIVAKCAHCLYELNHEAVEQDVKCEPQGNFSSNGIGFRLRILQKSHLPTRHIDEQLYGCVFCIHEGKTIDESDATVFFNQKQLFTHMARHQRPLPSLTSLTIVEGPEIPGNFQNNFDLHFPNPPVQSVMSGIAREVGKLPVAIAIETRRNAHGILRTPPDRGAVLQFAIGARIVGIEFPAKYEGKWGIGWHDGVRAAFEADSVHLDAPPKSETRMQGSSDVQGVARWKWSQKGEGNWLKFDKGDVVRNISWTYTDHWCWSGTSGKGWGIFPHSHLEPHSIRQVGPDTESISSSEKKSGLVGLGRFSIRKTGDKKPDRRLPSPRNFGV